MGIYPTIVVAVCGVHGAVSGSVVSSQASAASMLTCQVTGVYSAVVVAVCRVGSAMGGRAVSSQSTSTTASCYVMGVHSAVIIAVGWVECAMSGGAGVACTSGVVKRVICSMGAVGSAG
jgi:hypothetical protein